MKLPQQSPQGPFEAWPNFSVTIDKPGLLDTLRVQPAPRRAPGYGEVEIEVHSVALNFKEVLQALGVMPPPPDGFAFGLECAGVITEVGPDVVGLEPGMDVIAIEGPCLGARVTVNASSVVRKPPHLPWEQAAGLGISFLTAYYALHRLGRLRRGESVLIHAATGGVGLAAVQVAQWLGAEVFATAGSPVKREYLQRLGIRHVYDSRTLGFRDEIMEQTGNHGVDVVLNSLAGDFIAKGLATLAPFGRFLEIGRRDVLANTPIPLGLLEKGIGFFVVNLSTGTPGFQELLSEVFGLIEDGTFKPLPCKYFSLRRLEEAFDLLARAQHIGKVVVNLPQRNAALSVDSLPPLLLALDLDAAAPRSTLTEGLLSGEGLDVFRRVLAGNLAQVVVSTRSLDARMVEIEAPALTQLPQLAQLPHLDEEADGAAHPVAARPESSRDYVPPRNDLEGTICGIWEKFFRLKLIGIQDNFFDIGGDSLLAVQLIARLREAVGVELSPHSLLETPTIAGLAETIARAKASSPEIRIQTDELPRCLVKIKDGDPTQPLFLIHPAGGHVYNYLALAHTLSTPHEVYGVMCDPVDSNQRPMTTLEEMGRHYSREIRKLQPQGPYLLGGASFGGALAYDIAQHLVAGGQDVGLVFLLDTGSPEGLPKVEIEDAEVLEYLLRLAANIPDSREDLKQLLPDEQIRYFLERGKKANKLFPAVSMADAQQILQQSRTNLRAMSNYKPRPFPGRLVLFQASERDARFDMSDAPWPRLALGGGAVYSVPGNHITMNFMPHVQVLGDKLSQLLMETAANADKR